MHLLPPPIVDPAVECVVWDGGRQCGRPTGSTVPGVDADACPEHRALMAQQREGS